jgi:hypothetical protein
MKYLLTIVILAFVVTDLFSQDYIIKLSYKKSEDRVFLTNGIDALTIKEKQKVVTTLITDSTGIVRIPASMIKSGNDYDVYLRY